MLECPAPSGGDVVVRVRRWRCACGGGCWWLWVAASAEWTCGQADTYVCTVSMAHLPTPEPSHCKVRASVQGDVYSKELECV